MVQEAECSNTAPIVRRAQVVREADHPLGSREPLQLSALFSLLSLRLLHDVAVTGITGYYCSNFGLLFQYFDAQPLGQVC